MIEIKDTSEKDTKRLVIYFGDEAYNQSIGIKLTKSDLYSFYIELREKIKEIDSTLVSENEDVKV